MALVVNAGGGAHGGSGTAGGVPKFKRGGTKRGDGPAKLHKNEDIMAPRRKKKSKRMKGRRGGR